jgi:serine phosphatase RsbU (regulator of sigma subunit)
VSTQLLVEAKAHIVSLVREFTLARAERALLGSSIFGAVDELIDTVTTGFAAARTEIKRQALAAARRGDVMTELVLHLPASAADAAEAYLAALDETDRLARAAQLLTLATPPVHRVFRRWYLGAVVSQVRAQAEGLVAPPSAPFVDALADEVTELSSLRDAWNRLQLLEKVTGELTAAHTVEQIGRTVVQNAADFLGALVARIHVLGDDGILRMIAGRGGVTDLMEQYSEFPIDADLPASIVVRTGESMILRNRREIEARFPPLAGAYPVERILHIVPLRVDDRAIGCLTLTFPEGSHLEEAGQLAFVEALAQTLAQAVGRAVIMQRLEDANRQLAFLADASAALTSSLDYSATVTAVARVMVPRLADWCIVEVVQDGRLRPVAVRHAELSKQAWGMRMAERFPTRMDASVGSANVLRTGRSELHIEITEALVRELAADGAHLAALHGFGMRSGLIVPLQGRGGTLGTITLLYAESGRRYEPSDVLLVEDVALRAARALETAGAVREQSIRLATVTSIAEAAQHAILAPPPRQLGPVALSARYLSAAAEAQVGGDLYEVVERPGAVRLLIGDVRGKGLAAVRTATVVLGEFRAAAADVDDLVAVAPQLDRRLRPYLDPEDFVTALLAQIDDGGLLTVASCGHPPPLLASGGRLTEVGAHPGVPLGLGAAPSTVTRQLSPGDRLLLYTDGIMEARDEHNVFINFMKLAETVALGPFDLALDRLLDALDEAVGENLGDDLALVLAEYHGDKPER